MESHEGVQGVLWGAEGALGSGVQVLAVGMEGADREQLRRMVTSEDPRYIYHGSSLAELEGELTDDLCTIISTRVRARVPQRVWRGSSPSKPGGSPIPGFTQACLFLPARAEAEALHCAVPQGEPPHAVPCHGVP